MRVAAVLILVFMLGACAQGKAHIDYTMSEGIVWPGEPETPRIRYLWSMKVVSGGKGLGKIGRFITGEAGSDDTDPRSSDFLTRPQGLFVAHDTLYIADAGAARVTVINLKEMNSFNITKAGRWPLMTPIGVAADDQGRIYVTDAQLRSVIVFDKKGKLVNAFEGALQRPTGIALNPVTGLVYVADTWGHVVYIYNLEGKRQGSIGMRGEDPGQFNYPTYLSLDRDGNLYVSDTLNFRIQIFSPSGTYLDSFGLIGDTYDSFDKTKGIAVDSEGYIYVVDSAQDMIKIFDNKGNLMLFFGRKGHFYGQFFLPTGIFIDKDNRIFVSDTVNRRIQVFQFLGGN